jgi:hypothetical protein
MYLNVKIPGELVLVFHVGGCSSDVDACVVVVAICRPSHVSVIARQMRKESQCGKSTRRQSQFNIVSSSATSTTYPQNAHIIHHTSTSLRIL